MRTVASPHQSKKSSLVDGSNRPCAAHPAKGDTPPTSSDPESDHIGAVSLPPSTHGGTATSASALQDGHHRPVSGHGNDANTNIRRGAGGSLGSHTNHNDHADATGCSSHTGWSRFRIFKELGSGSFGVVYVCQDLKPDSPFFGDLVAIKTVPLLPLSPAEAKLAMGEVAILQNLHHPHILKYIDCFIDDEQQLCTVTEYVDGGDLATLIKRQRATWRRPLLVPPPVADPVAAASASSSPAGCGGSGTPAATKKHNRLPRAKRFGAFDEDELAARDACEGALHFEGGIASPPPPLSSPPPQSRENSGSPQSSLRGGGGGRPLPSTILSANGSGSNGGSSTHCPDAGTEAAALNPDGGDRGRAPTSITMASIRQEQNHNNHHPAYQSNNDYFEDKPFLDVSASTFMEASRPPTTNPPLDPSSAAASALIDQYVDSFVVIDIARQLLDALTYLHSQMVIHRDIKPANIFITSQGIVKIGDFGVSKLVSDEDPLATTFIGTPHYICPELCLGEPYSFPADVWALGVVLYELYTLEQPFDARNVLALMHVVSDGLYDKDLLTGRQFSLHQAQDIQKHFGPEYLLKSHVMGALTATIVREMLEPDALQRPSACDVFHKYFGQSVRGSAASLGSGGGALNDNRLSIESVPRMHSPHPAAGALDERTPPRRPSPPPGSSSVTARPPSRPLTEQNDNAFNELRASLDRQNECIESLQSNVQEAHQELAMARPSSGSFRRSRIFSSIASAVSAAFSAVTGSGSGSSSSFSGRQQSAASLSTSANLPPATTTSAIAAISSSDRFNSARARPYAAAGPAPTPAPVPTAAPHLLGLQVDATLAALGGDLDLCETSDQTITSARRQGMPIGGGDDTTSGGTSVRQRSPTASVRLPPLAASQPQPQQLSSSAAAPTPTLGSRQASALSLVSSVGSAGTGGLSSPLLSSSNAAAKPVVEPLVVADLGLSADEEAEIIREVNDVPWVVHAEALSALLLSECGDQVMLIEKEHRQRSVAGPAPMTSTSTRASTSNKRSGSMIDSPVANSVGTSPLNASLVDGSSSPAAALVGGGGGGGGHRRQHLNNPLSSAKSHHAAESGNETTSSYTKNNATSAGPSSDLDAFEFEEVAVLRTPQRRHSSTSLQGSQDSFRVSLAKQHTNNTKLQKKQHDDEDSSSVPPSNDEKGGSNDDSNTTPLNLSLSQPVSSARGLLTLHRLKRTASQDSATAAPIRDRATSIGSDLSGAAQQQQLQQHQRTPVHVIAPATPRRVLESVASTPRNVPASTIHSTLRSGRGAGGRVGSLPASSLVSAGAASSTDPAATTSKSLDLQKAELGAIIRASAQKMLYRKLQQERAEEQQQQHRHEESVPPPPPPPSSAAPPYPHRASFQETSGAASPVMVAVPLPSFDKSPVKSTRARTSAKQQDQLQPSPPSALHAERDDDMFADTELPSGSAARGGAGQDVEKRDAGKKFGAEEKKKMTKSKTSAGKRYAAPNIFQNTNKRAPSSSSSSMASASDASFADGDAVGPPKAPISKLLTGMVAKGKQLLSNSAEKKKKPSKGGKLADKTSGVKQPPPAPSVASRAALAKANVISTLSKKPAAAKKLKEKVVAEEEKVVSDKEKNKHEKEELTDPHAKRIDAWLLQSQTPQLTPSAAEAPAKYHDEVEQKQLEEKEDEDMVQFFNREGANDKKGSANTPSGGGIVKGGYYFNTDDYLMRGPSSASELESSMSVASSSTTTEDERDELRQDAAEEKDDPLFLKNNNQNEMIQQQQQLAPFKQPPVTQLQQTQQYSQRTQKEQQQQQQKEDDARDANSAHVFRDPHALHELLRAKALEVHRKRHMAVAQLRRLQGIVVGAVQRGQQALSDKITGTTSVASPSSTSIAPQSPSSLSISSTSPATKPNNMNQDVLPQQQHQQQQQQQQVLRPPLHPATEQQLVQKKMLLGNKAVMNKMMSKKAALPTDRHNKDSDDDANSTKAKKALSGPMQLLSKLTHKKKSATPTTDSLHSTSSAAASPEATTTPSVDSSSVPITPRSQFSFNGGCGSDDLGGAASPSSAASSSSMQNLYREVYRSAVAAASSGGAHYTSMSTSAPSSAVPSVMPSPRVPEQQVQQEQQRRCTPPNNSNRARFRSDDNDEESNDDASPSAVNGLPSLSRTGSLPPLQGAPVNSGPGGTGGIAGESPVAFMHRNPHHHQHHGSFSSAASPPSRVNPLFLSPTTATSSAAATIQSARHLVGASNNLTGLQQQQGSLPFTPDERQRPRTTGETPLRAGSGSGAAVVMAGGGGPAARSPVPSQSGDRHHRGSSAAPTSTNVTGGVSTTSLPTPPPATNSSNSLHANAEAAAAIREFMAGNQKLMASARAIAVTYVRREAMLEDEARQFFLESAKRKMMATTAASTQKQLDDGNPDDKGSTKASNNNEAGGTDFPQQQQSCALSSFATRAVPDGHMLDDDDDEDPRLFMQIIVPAEEDDSDNENEDNKDTGARREERTIRVKGLRASATPDKVKRKVLKTLERQAPWLGIVYESSSDDEEEEEEDEEEEDDDDEDDDSTASDDEHNTGGAFKQRKMSRREEHRRRKEARRLKKENARARKDMSVLGLHYLGAAMASAAAGIGREAGTYKNSTTLLSGHQDSSDNGRVPAHAQATLLPIHKGSDWMRAVAMHVSRRRGDGGCAGADDNDGDSTQVSALEPMTFIIQKRT